MKSAGVFVGGLTSVLTVNLMLVVVEERRRAAHHDRLAHIARLERHVDSGRRPCFDIRGVFQSLEADHFGIDPVHARRDRLCAVPSVGRGDHGSSLTGVAAGDRDWCSGHDGAGRVGGDADNGASRRLCVS